MASFETQLLLNLNELEFDTSTELTVEAIKSRYKKLSLHYHPDLNNNEIFRDKQKKINGAKEFLLNNLDDVNRYIRKINHKETDEDKARNEKEQWEQDERARRAYYEQEARKRQEAAKAEQEKAKAEQEKAKAEQEKRNAEAKARNAQREAEAERARTAAAEARAREAENARRAAESKSNKIKTAIITVIVLVIGIPLIIGCIMAGIEGFNEGMVADKQSEEAANKEARTRNISDTNLPKSIVKGASINWSDYYVTYKDASGKEVTVTLASGMVNIDYTTFNEQKAEISINNGEVYLYHSLTVIDATVISNAEGLKAIASNPKGTYILDSDIDLGGAEWTPIASLEGILVGNGHTIKNLTITSFTTKNVGLFDTIAEKASISDIKLENVSINSTSAADSIGALAGTLMGTAKNITVTGKIESVGSSAVGGVVGVCQSWFSSISNCSFDGTIVGNAGVGGIVGGKDARGQTIIENCTVSGNISGISQVGGIAGDLYSYGANVNRIQNCKNNATISAKLDCCGGIVGRIYNTNNSGVPEHTILNCENNGAISGGNYTAGIVGCFNTSEATLDNNVNKANINGKNYTAGIIGYISCPVTVNASQNSGNIVGEAYTGGFIGYGNRATLNGLTNSNNVSGHYYVGGIVGYGESVANCTNNGNISASLVDTEKSIVAIGGVCGRIETVEGCINNGSITSKSGAGVGGVIGVMENHSYDSRKITNCKNGGKVIIDGGVANGVGGVIGSFINRNGYGNIAFSITGCENTGDIEASSGKGVGGIIGLCATNKALTIISCSSNANITATNCTSVGGILGVDSTSDKYNLAKIEFVTVKGNIQAKSAVGSIIGSTAVVPDNYESIKVTYTVEVNNSIKHFGAIG